MSSWKYVLISDVQLFTINTITFAGTGFHVFLEESYDLISYRNIDTNPEFKTAFTLEVHKTKRNY